MSASTRQPSPQNTHPQTLHPQTLEELNREIVACTLCPRLIAHCRKVGQEKRRAYLDWEYWAKPVPGFGDPQARLLILGLAPGAHGSNRTGRPFTGDGSGNFLYPVLHKAGFASQPKATHRGDGLRLLDAYITAAVRCAPPENKPTPQEIANCAAHLDHEFAALTNIKVVVVLGKIAFDAYLNYLKRRGELKYKSAFLFGHGESYALPDGRTLLCSYHPSLQNTLTGKLTEKMFLDVFRKAARLIQKK
jgi:uracil-DNA glycosylase